jgi:hypothetical protein
MFGVMQSQQPSQTRNQPEPDSKVQKRPDLPFKDLHRLKFYSYLSGSDLLHKISRLNKKERQLLPGSGLLDQVKVIVLKHFPHNLSHMHYALRIIDAIEYRVDKNSSEELPQTRIQVKEDQRQVFRGGEKFQKAELFAEVLQLWNQT